MVHRCDFNGKKQAVHRMQWPVQIIAGSSDYAGVALLDSKGVGCVCPVNLLLKIGRPSGWRQACRAGRADISVVFSFCMAAS